MPCKAGNQSPLPPDILEGGVFLAITGFSRNFWLENHQLLRGRLALLGLCVTKMEPASPLFVAHANHTNLPTLWKMRLDGTEHCMVLTTGRPVFRIDTELDHYETPNPASRGET